MNNPESLPTYGREGNLFWVLPNIKLFTSKNNKNLFRDSEFVK